MKAQLVEIRCVSKRFGKRLDLVERMARRLGSDVGEETVHAVDGVSLSIAEGEVLGLVGESGCGKSTLGRLAIGLLSPSEGAVLYRGEDVGSLSGGRAKAARLNRQMIFQDPMSSLNPRMQVRDIIGEAPLYHRLVAKRELESWLDALMARVGLEPSFKDRYPHQFSGGQRQRIGIARALAVSPDFLVCDEPIAALDVSIQAQIINLFMTLRAELGLTSLFISHDIGVIEHVSDRVAVMYLGRIVESCPTAELFARTNHPYTKALLAEVPRLDRRKQGFAVVKGEIPSPLAPPPGCHFHPRCPSAMGRCAKEVPALREIEGAHYSACHLNDQQ